MKKIGWYAIAAVILLAFISICINCSKPKISYENSATLDTITVTNYVKKVVTNYVYVFKETNTGLIDYNKDNVFGIGYSICNRFMIKYDRLDIINLGKLGLGLGGWATINTIEPSRRLDFGININGTF